MRTEEAWRQARRAAELDPFSLLVHCMVGWVLFNQRRYDEAIEVFDRVLELEPEFGLAIYNKGLAYAQLGNGAEVVLAARKAVAVRVRMAEPMATWLLGIGHALSGDRDRAEEILRKLEAGHAAGTFHYAGLIAALHHVTGDDGEALDWLEKACDERYPLLPNLTSEPWFDELRHHPRFQAVRAKMGLP